MKRRLLALCHAVLILSIVAGLAKAEIFQDVDEAGNTILTKVNPAHVRSAARKKVDVPVPEKPTQQNESTPTSGTMVIKQPRLSVRPEAGTSRNMSFAHASFPRVSRSSQGQRDVLRRRILEDELR